jgi:hypothetical protein
MPDAAGIGIPEIFGGAVLTGLDVGVAVGAGVGVGVWLLAVTTVDGWLTAPELLP